MLAEALKRGLTEAEAAVIADMVSGFVEDNRSLLELLDSDPTVERSEVEKLAAKLAAAEAVMERLDHARAMSAASKYTVYAKDAAAARLDFEARYPALPILAVRMERGAAPADKFVEYTVFA